MPYRVHRDTRTRPRKVHATDGEWGLIKTAAAWEELTASAYLVKSGLERARNSGKAEYKKLVREASSCREALWTIADRLERTPPDIHIRDALLKLWAIELLLEDLLFESRQGASEEEESCF